MKQKPNKWLVLWVKLNYLKLLNKVEFKKVTIKSFDNLTLVGHYYDAQSNKTVCLVHGYSANYKEMQQYAKYFYQKGYNLLCQGDKMSALPPEQGDAGGRT